MQQSLAIGESRDIYTPGRLNNEVKRTLETTFRSIWIEGEISNLSRPSSGHAYFSLKDASAQVRCAWFRQNQLRCPTTPENGMQVLLRARVSLYPARGDYQLLVERLEEAGRGQLQQEYEALKARLAREGLFAEQHKRPLPRFPKRIAIVTSPSGAAVKDVLNVLERRWPGVLVTVVPSLVQGEKAAAQLLAGLGLANELEPSVILLTRGGGSLEDLWAFNDEQLARAIHASRAPVVVAVGHEIDFTIADFVADVRAPTPSAAAELLVPERTEIEQRFDDLQAQLGNQIQAVLQRNVTTVEYLHKRLHSKRPEQQLATASTRLRDLSKQLKNRMHGLLELHSRDAASLDSRLQRCNPAHDLHSREDRVVTMRRRLDDQLRQKLELCNARLAGASRSLDAISPLAVLHRGYSMTSRADGSIVRNTEEVEVGEVIQTRLESGVLASKITKVEP